MLSHLEIKTLDKIGAERILTHSGSADRSFAVAFLELGIGQRVTRAYRPKANGKAERLSRALLTEWTYVRACARGRTHPQLVPPSPLRQLPMPAQCLGRPTTGLSLSCASVNNVFSLHNQVSARR